MNGGPRRLDAIVVGAGLSGLVCASRLQKRGVNVAILEAAAEPGGSIKTLRTSRYIADGGPQSFLLTNELLELARELGIESRLVRAAPSTEKRYLYGRRGLIALPTSLAAFIGWPSLSIGAKLRLLAEPLVARRRVGEEESVSSFVRRRAGAELLDEVVAPFVSGIYAGEPDLLSVQSVFPALAKLEHDQGSVLLGGIRRMRERGGAERAPSVAFEGGNDALTRASAERLGRGLSVRARVTRVSLKGAGFAVDGEGVPGGRLTALKVVLAVPAAQAGELVGFFEPDAAVALRSIAYAPVAQIVLAYPSASIGIPLDGFGFLAARSGGLRILGAVWNSAVYPDRCPAGEVLITAFAGGVHAELAAQPDEVLVKVAHEDLCRAMKIRDAGPKVVAGFRWEHAIPQYTIGHEERVRRIEAAQARLPGLRFCGNYLRGVSVSDCIRQATQAADSLL